MKILNLNKIMTFWSKSTTLVEDIVVWKMKRMIDYKDTGFAHPKLKEKKYMKFLRKYVRKNFPILFLNVLFQQ